MGKGKQIVAWLGWIGLGLPLIGAVGVYFLFKGNESEEQVVRRIAKQGGIAISTEELYPPFKGRASDNAWNFAPNLEAHPGDVDPVTGDRASPDLTKDVELLRPNVAKSKQYFADVEQFAECPQWAPVRRGAPYDVLMPEWAWIKASAKWLVVRARLREKDGEMALALEDIARIFKLSGLMAKDPEIIALLVNYACVAIADAELAWLLPIVAQDPSLSAKAKQIVSMTPPTDYPHMFAGEATNIAYISIHPLPDELTIGLWPKQAELTRSYWGPKSVGAWADFLTEIRKDPTNPDAVDVADLKILEPLRDTKDPRMSLAAVLLPTFKQAGNAGRVVKARQDLLRLGLEALEKHRPPVTDGTTDPLSGHPYRLIVNGAGWKLYSVGADHIDDGAVETEYKVSGVPTKASKDLVLDYDGTSAKFLGK